MQFPRFSVLILLLLLLLSACGDDQPAETTAAPSTTSTAATSVAFTTTLPPTTTTSLPPTTTTAAVSSTADVSPEVTGDLVYATWGEEPLTLDMYTPTESGEWPVVIYFPGRQAPTPPWITRDLVMQGVIVFDVEYAFGHHPPGPFEELIADRGAGHRAIAESAACAIHYARARASEKGSESPVVVLAGFSLGAGVAARAALFGDGIEARWEEYAVARGGPPRQVDCEITDGSTQVDAIVGTGGPYVTFVGYEGPTGREFMQDRDPDLWEFLYGSIGENPDLRVRLLHGETDTDVPYEISVAFEAVLTEAGYDVQLIPFDGGHWEPSDLFVTTIIDAIQP